MVRVRVSRYRRKVGSKTVTVDSHMRKSNPVGKKRIVDKKPVKLYPVRDQYGHILGTKPTRKVI